MEDENNISFETYIKAYNANEYASALKNLNNIFNNMLEMCSEHPKAYDALQAIFRIFTNKANEYLCKSRIFTNKENEYLCKAISELDDCNKILDVVDSILKESKYTKEQKEFYSKFATDEFFNLSQYDWEDKIVLLYNDLKKREAK